MEWLEKAPLRDRGVWPGRPRQAVLRHQAPDLPAKILEARLPCSPAFTPLVLWQDR